MPDPVPNLLRLAIALGIGLLIGVERERRKGSGPHREYAGVRTFALVALLGALASHLGGTPILAVSALLVVALSYVAYRSRRSTDPGVTTEVALLVTLLLGALALEQPAAAAALGVCVAAILAVRDRLHRFVSRVLTEAELHDALMLAAAVLLILPWLPDRVVDPFAVVNPRQLWKLAVMMMCLSAAGHIAMRLLGPGDGLPLAGFASGFISSTATVAAMGARAKTTPNLLNGAAAGANLSSMATVIQLALVLAVSSLELLKAMTWPLLLAGMAVTLYSLVFVRRGRSHAATFKESGRAFEPKSVIFFTALVGTVQLLAAACARWLGESGPAVAAAVAGFVDVHAASASTAALVKAGQTSLPAATIAVLLAFTMNTIAKIVFAVANGSAAYIRRVVPGLLIMALAAWMGWFFRIP